MTVNEAITELTKLKDGGYGDLKVRHACHNDGFINPDYNELDSFWLYETECYPNSMEDTCLEKFVNTDFL